MNKGDFVQILHPKYRGQWAEIIELIDDDSVFQKVIVRTRAGQTFVMSEEFLRIVEK